MMRGKEKKEEKKDEGKEGERRGEKCPGALLVSGLQLPPPPFRSCPRTYSARQLQVWVQ